MDLNQFDVLVNILIYIASGLGALGLIMIGAIFKVGRRITVNELHVEQNTDAIEELKNDLKEHEEHCIDFRKSMARKFDAGSEEFKKIHHSLGKIEGLLDSKKKSS